MNTNSRFNKLDIKFVGRIKITLIIVKIQVARKHDFTFKRPAHFPSQLSISNLIPQISFLLITKTSPLIISSLGLVPLWWPFIK